MTPREGIGMSKAIVSASARSGPSLRRSAIAPPFRRPVWARHGRPRRSPVNESPSDWSTATVRAGRLGRNAILNHLRLTEYQVTRGEVVDRPRGYGRDGEGDERR